jgi:hypothetical protein
MDPEVEAFDFSFPEWSTALCIGRTTKGEPVASCKRLRSKTLITVACVLSVVTIFVLYSGSAGASNAGNYVDWDCGNMAPNTWCQWGYQHTYDWTQTSYTGGYNINLCAKLIAPNSNPEFLYSRACLYGVLLRINSDGLGHATYPNYNTLMMALGANGDNPSYHFVRMRAEY